MKIDSETYLQRAYDRERKARLVSEEIANTISLQLYDANTKLEELVRELDKKVSVRTLALEKANSRIKRALRANKDGIAERNYESAFDNWLFSDCFLQLLGGYSNEELISLFTNLEIIHDEDRRLVKLAIIEHFRSGESLVIECRLKVNNQGYNWFLFSGMAERNPQTNKITGLTISIKDIDSRIKSALILSNQLHQDGLTKLPNRLGFERQFISGNKSESGTFTVVTFDINDFKSVNTIYGYQVGDELLKVCAQRVNNTMNSYDFAARVAGDEFIIVMANATNVEQVQDKCQTLLKLLSKPIDLNTSESLSSSTRLLVPKLSMGVAIFPRDGDSIQQVLMKSEYARSLVKSKKLKESGLQLFEERFNDTLAFNKRISIDIITALENNEFYLCFQPIISLTDQTCQKFEALIRWQHPNLGNIPPDKFISIAEETGAIIQIGEMVIEEACKQIRVWLDEGIQATVAVNVSAIQFTDISLLQTITSMLLKYRVPSELLGVEVTESVLDNNLVNTSKIVKSFHDLGITISLDDFGTGYSCLSYIQNLHLDIIKIDKAFIDGVESNLQSQGITKAIIQMAHALGLKAVAEGVETHQQLAFLEENNCDFIQGYYFSKPIKGEVVLSYLKNFELESNKETLFKNEDRERKANESFIANYRKLLKIAEKEKHAAKLVTAYETALFEVTEKEKWASELVTTYETALFETSERNKLATDPHLVIDNRPLSIVGSAFYSSAGIVVSDKNNTILSVNPAFTIITGHTFADVIGQKLPSVLFGNQEMILAWSQASQQEHWEGEMLSVRKNGDAYQQFLTIKAVKDEYGVISHYVSTFIDITKITSVDDQIKTLAFYDPLTMLPNRRLFAERVKHAQLTSNRLEKSCALMLIDIDHFKTLNDTLGHSFGDLLLQQSATRLSDCIREVDTVARIGGDEFVVLLEGLSIETFEAKTQTEVIAQKILYSLNQLYHLDEHEYHSSASIGMTIFRNNNVALDVILKEADIAMYQAKANGRNSICFFDLNMEEDIVARADMEKDLREAIKNNSFQLYYQIQVDSTGRRIGAEALIRWKHPQRGIICPSDFIDFAGESRLTLPIGQWVLDAACAQLKIWQQNPLMRDLVLGINISARQFHQKDFAKQVKKSLQMHKVNPALLKLELTENMLVKNISDITKTMNALNKIGVCFSLDDFGTGYSSLRCLKILPVDELKIDKSFLREITAGPSDKAIVSAIIRMANSLNINVIAEGVETEEQRQCLLDIGCSNYQGYLFGDPVPIDEFEALLKKG